MSYLRMSIVFDKNWGKWKCGLEKIRKQRKVTGYFLLCFYVHNEIPSLFLDQKYKHHGKIKILNTGNG